MPAEALIGQKRPAILDPIGALDNQREWHIRRGGAPRIAQQRGDGNGLTGPIDAAFRVNERIEPDRYWPAGNAAVGQVERRRLQAQKGIVALFACDDRGGCGTAFAARKARLEMNEAIAVALTDGKHFIVACDQPYLNAAAWLGGRERVNEHVYAVVG